MVNVTDQPRSAWPHNPLDVRFGSGTDISRPDFYVRFAPNNGHWSKMKLIRTASGLLSLSGLDQHSPPDLFADNPSVMTLSRGVFE